MKTLTKIQITLAIVSFCLAVAFAIAGFCVPPEGEIHDSVLYLIAQFLLLTASLFGVGAVFSTARFTARGVESAPPVQVREPVGSQPQKSAAAPNYSAMNNEP